MHTEVIVITGPESAGKTTLASQLSAYWKLPLIAEEAREFLRDRHTYQQCDLLEIAKQQHEKEQSVLSLFPNRIVCDTDLLVIMVWSEVKYGHCDPWIYETFERCIAQTSTSRHYYLCDSNIPWQADPLRENPHNRDELFELYRQKLKKYTLDFSIVKGNPQQRLQQVVDDFNS